MDRVLDEEINYLFKKYNIPLELVEILAEDAIRVSLDARSGIDKGLTFSSKDDSKLFAITRCIDKIRRLNPVYSEALDLSGCISYANNSKFGIERSKKEQMIDLDNINLSNERTNALFRYTDTFIENKCTINQLNAEINGMSKCYSQLRTLEYKIKLLNKKIEEYKAKVTAIEISPIPNIFRHRKLKRYTQKVRTYMAQMSSAERLREKSIVACEKADELVIPRKKRRDKVVAYNGIINSRIGELIQKYKVSPDVLKQYVTETLTGTQLTEVLTILPSENVARESGGR